MFLFFSNVFYYFQRPIVAFSIENKKVLNAKKLQMEKSKLNNPTYQQKRENKKESDTAKNTFKKNKKASAEPTGDFVGLSAKEGHTKMRSKYKLTTQANIHHETLKQRKKQLKNKKKTFMESKKDFIRQPQQKQNTKKKKVDKDNFTDLVNKYKTNLIVNKKAKNKWYE